MQRKIKTMPSGKVMTSGNVTQLMSQDEAFLNFIQDSIMLFLSLEKPFLVYAREGVPPICVRRDEDCIWIALLSELGGD
jgi:hypothetical protein